MSLSSVFLLYDHRCHLRGKVKKKRKSAIHVKYFFNKRENKSIEIVSTVVA